MRQLIALIGIVVTLITVGSNASAREPAQSITVAVVGAEDEQSSLVAKPPFHTTIGRKGSRIRVEAGDDKTIFDITSEFGIDKATVTRLNDEWPTSIVVRLRLKGLESFKVSNDEVTVQWAVGGDSESRVTLWKGQEEIPLDKDSPYFTKAQIVGDGKLLDKDAYIEVPLPAKLFERKPKEIRLNWIDFYR